MSFKKNTMLSGVFLRSKLTSAFSSEKDVSLNQLKEKTQSFNPYIMKTCLYNFDPLKPHFYIVKLGFTGYTLFFLFLLKNVDCGYSLEPPR